MTNSVDPEQAATLGAVWSGSALFAKTYLSENLGSLRYCKIVLQACIFLIFCHVLVYDFKLLLIKYHI